MSAPLRICYLLMSTELCGGVRVVFDQARFLARLGHHIEIRAVMGRHDWYPHPLRVCYLPELDAPFAAEEFPDAVIATFWTTVQPALQIGARVVAHLCQGYEGDIREYVELLPRIEATYRTPIPKLTVGPWLKERLHQRYGTATFPVIDIGQIVDTDLFRPPHLSWRRALRRRLDRPWRILVVGQFGVDVKAIGDALHAIAQLRQEGRCIHLLRASTAALTAEEAAITVVDDYHQSIPPTDMRDLLLSADILVAPSLEGEGFGLPLAEALACGVACVATRIASFTRFAPKADYAAFADPGHPASLAQALARVMDDDALRRHLQQRGPGVVRERYAGTAVAHRIETVLRDQLTAA
jgi:glycosyltransferase involved in cell wall biosynthesis